MHVTEFEQMHNLVMINIFDGVEGWPVQGDPVFSDQPKDWDNNACFNFSTNPTNGYIESYRLAGRAILLQAMSEPSAVDYFVYALVFSYRQFLELTLKEIIEQGNAALGRDETPGLSHKLHPLWAMAKPIILELEPTSERSVLKTVGVQIDELDRLDPDSIVFRYAKAKNGQQTVPATLLRFNVRHFAIQIERIGNFLEAVRMSISAHLEYRAELDVSFRRDYEVDIHNSLPSLYL